MVVVDREKPAIIEWLAIGVVSEVFTGHGETAKGYPSVILDSIQTQITPCFHPLDQLQEPPADLLRGERRVVGWRGGYGHSGRRPCRWRGGGRVWVGASGREHGRTAGGPAGEGSVSERTSPGGA